MFTRLIYAGMDLEVYIAIFIYKKKYYGRYNDNFERRT